MHRLVVLLSLGLLAPLLHAAGALVSGPMLGYQTHREVAIWLEVENAREVSLNGVPGDYVPVTIAGFSLLSNISQTYAGFYFVQLDPWDERGERTADVIMRELNLRLREMPEGQAFAFGPPSIPGVGNAGGFDMMLQDRSGSDGVAHDTESV